MPQYAIYSIDSDGCGDYVVGQVFGESAARALNNARASTQFPDIYPEGKLYAVVPVNSANCPTALFQRQVLFSLKPPENSLPRAVSAAVRVK